MTKTSIASAFLAASLILTGCGSSSDEEKDYRDDLTDLELAKDFTQRFTKVESAIIDMQQPMIETAEQFLQDTSQVNSDAVEASLETLEATLALAISSIGDAFTRNELNEITAVDYSQIQASYTLAELLSACEATPCFPSVDLTSSASVTFQNNTLSVNNAQITAELYPFSYQWTPENDYSEAILVRGDSKGVFTSTISFDITLPSEDLENNNTASLTISNVRLSSSDTSFVVSMDEVGATGVVQSQTNLSLYDLITSENEILLDSLNAVLDEAVVQYGDATFKGELTFNGQSQEVGTDSVSKISGELINSVGESVKAVFDLTLTAYQYIHERNSDSNETPEGEIEYTYSKVKEESYSFSSALELTFDSSEHGELVIDLSAIGSYSKDLNNSSESTYNSETGANTGFSNKTGIENLLSDGNIQISVAGETLELTYSLENKVNSEGSGEDYSDMETYDYSYSELEIETSSLRITDASYLDRDLYIIIDMETQFGSGYSDSIELGFESSNINEFDLSSGVYVDNILYGEYEFDALSNTQEIVFIDGSSISL